MESDDTLFRDLLDQARDLIQVTSPAGRLLHVNGAWLKALGYDRAEIGGLSLSKVIHPDSRRRFQRVVRELLAGGPPVDVEADLRSRDGRRVSVRGTAACRVGAARETAVVGVFRETADGEAAREELGRLFSLSLDLLCVAGLDGYLKQVNPAFERLLGYGREELLSRPFIELVHPDDRTRTLAEMARLERGLPVVDFQNRYRARDGAWRWLEWRSAALVERGMVYAVAREITEQKRLEETLARQAEELARSNADLEQFAYVASHDLRAPLSSLPILAGWIEEELPARAPRKIREHLDTLRRRVARMHAMIDDLLACARAGRREADIRRVDTAALIRELTFLLAPPAGFIVTAEGEMPVMETSRGPLWQVFLNLVGNAIKHHDRSDGKIVVSARPRDGFWEFRVSDDGPGIPRRFQDRIFRMFKQVRPRDQVAGSGIGLALVKRIVEAQGGHVWVESGKGRGATFRFTWSMRPSAGGEVHVLQPRRA